MLSKLLPYRPLWEQSFWNKGQFRKNKNMQGQSSFPFSSKIAIVIDPPLLMEKWGWGWGLLSRDAVCRTGEQKYNHILREST